MVGTIASGLTVAALFKGCIEAFDIVHLARHQDADLEKLTLKFSIEKCRLYVWGMTMGLTTLKQPEQPHPLESLHQCLVRRTLQEILDTFRDTQKMRQRYGCREISSSKKRKRSLRPLSLSDPIKNLAATFSNFNIAGASRDSVKNFSLQTRWAIHDRKSSWTL